MEPSRPPQWVGAAALVATHLCVALGTYILATQRTLPNYIGVEIPDYGSNAARRHSRSSRVQEPKNHEVPQALEEGETLLPPRR